MARASLEARERVMALLAQGLTVLEIAARLNYSPGYVYQARWEHEHGIPAPPPTRTRGAYAPWEPPSAWQLARRRALARGRALAAAKVAAGEWVRP